ncbi:unnamed protein product [Allacma fusca]|uniref:Uncharacterized protein n=1 Tax=Allacma fusca TaxID=39272 RepID=A0A8J2PHK8_9HEXA|nr:unnamed protein product [Allacma fusca]
MGRKRNHQKKSPAVDATDSPLLSCQVSPVYGRYLCTKVDVQKGDLLIKEKYLVAGPLSLSGVVCIGCHSDLSKKFFRFKCTKCSWPLCANKCQKSPFHAIECQFLLEHKILPPEEPDSVSYGAITVLRACLLKKTKPREYSKLMGLEAHNDIRKGLPLWDANEEHVVKVIRDEWKLGQDFTADEIHTICGILEVNGFEIGDVYSFLGLFAVTSMLAHDCVPNATHFENIDEGVMERQRR